MKQLFAAAGAALAIACTGASATASIAGTFGDMDYTFDFSGYGYEDYTFGNVLINPGDSYSQSFAYDLTLHNDGLALTQPRAWSACAPTGDFTVANPSTYCGPAFTGNEQVELDFGVARSPGANPNFQYSVTGAPASVNLGAGQTVHLSGVVTLTETWIGQGNVDFFGDDDALWVYSSVWIDSDKPAPLFSVPEPTEASLMLAGLALVAARARARRRSKA